MKENGNKFDRIFNLSRKKKRKITLVQKRFRDISFTFFKIWKWLSILKNSISINRSPWLLVDYFILKSRSRALFSQFDNHFWKKRSVLKSFFMKSKFREKGMLLLENLSSLGKNVLKIRISIKILIKLIANWVYTIFLQGIISKRAYPFTGIFLQEHFVKYRNFSKDRNFPVSSCLWLFFSCYNMENF